MRRLSQRPGLATVATEMHNTAGFSEWDSRDRKFKRS
jgi:hypothetical protein